MGWSTRQLADLAGTSVKAVRHYHRVGVLDEPTRLSNGYKQYQTSHLIRLLQIRRLSDLGIPLSRIALMDQSELPEASIRSLDEELRARIRELQRLRRELAVILAHGAPIDVPTEFAPYAATMTTTDRALVSVYSRVFDSEAVIGLTQMVAAEDETDRDFDMLPPDADDDRIRELAKRMVPQVRAAQARHAWARDPRGRAVVDAPVFDKAVGQAMMDLYNPAQLKTVILVDRMLADEEAQASGTESPTTA